MKALQDLQLFSLTAQLGSLSAAARQLGITPAAASAGLKRLEAELGTSLLIRSTRQLRLTEAGERFLPQCRQGLETLTLAAQGLQNDQAQFGGVLQLSLPSGLGRLQVLPLLESLQRAHPQMTLRLQITDRLSDLYAQPVDVALRYGQPSDSELIALPVNTDNRRVLCASPEYLARHGQPDSLEALSDHRCLCFMLGDYHHDRWRFARAGSERTVKIQPYRYADDGDVVRRWACMGAGIAYKSELEIRADVQAGRLQRLELGWQGEPAPLYLICAGRHRLTPVVRQLHDSLVQALAPQRAGLS
ncbi:LysR family transcriptional regulator [Ferrimonas marina]|uniref:DNA-binding transcriptional regulator, LysR family n=1 Tax=Ferrimonas marina TaxID=299255 RepID=A0A1M5RXW0_9GAMM|nr:LysR family transcriptional regulator [Ferrimonas marina]SHH30858.1 DNA-binding transcriptional regulator, LysR family [Ferrimonas marina]